MNSEGIWDLNVFGVAEQVLEEYADPIPFDDFDHYRLIQPIGRGGMGEVFLAHDEEANRSVAIKFLGACRWFEPDLQDRFKREIQMLGQLEHPFIARLYDAGIHPSGTPFFAMEYVAGKRLDVFCRERQYDLEQRLALFHSVCEAVQYAHSRAVIHLDLKPSNILVNNDGTPKLLDFGVAKQLTDLGEPVTLTQAAFTPGFAAPEQVRRGSVGTFTDVYALGVILYELLAERPPFEDDTANRERGTHAATAPERPSRSPNRIVAHKAAWRDLDVLCLRAIKHEVTQRYQSVLELLLDLDRFRDHEPLKARPDGFVYHASKFMRRNRRGLLVSALVLSAVVALVSFYTVRLTRARDAALAQEARTRKIEDFMLGMFRGGQEYDAAPPADLKVLDMLQRATQKASLLDKEPATQADLFESLGGIYQNLGDLDKASSLVQSSLKIREAILGANTPEAAHSMVWLAMVRVDQARFSEAEGLARRAVTIAKQYLPENDSLLGEAMMALGSALEHNGEFAEAAKVLQQDVALFASLPEQKVDYINALTFLSSSYLRMGETAKAEPLLKRILAEDRRLYGDRHPGVAEDLSNLSTLENQRGLYAESEQNARRALAIAREWYRRDNAEVGVIEESLGETLVYRHREDEAFQYLKTGLETVEREYGLNHPFVAYGLSWLGFIALERGHLDEAQTDFQRMADIYSKVFSSKDKHLAFVPYRFGQLQVARKQLPAAEQSFRLAISKLTDSIGPEKTETGAARIKLGEVLLREHRDTEAEAELLNGYHIVTRMGDTQLLAAVEARRDLVALYQALHMPEKAQAFREK